MAPADAHQSQGSTTRPIDRSPPSPASELSNMNGAETAAASRGVAHLHRIISGVSRIPPPIPTNPERTPIKPPMTAASGMGSGRMTASRCGMNIRTAAMTSVAATSRLNVGSLIEYAPARNAQGIEVIRNGHNNCQRKNPARTNMIVARAATRTFKINAEGRINAALTPSNAMIARYPDAPP